MKRVTLQDIADELGISRNTVSKAINNSDGIAAATRDKILQKAVEMGYKQFSYVNSILASDEITSFPVTRQYQGEIALLTAAFLTQSHFASTMLDKFQREISQAGFTMNSHRVTKENLNTMTLPFTFRKDMVKAVLCIEMFDYDYCKMICELDVPVLFVDGPVNGPVKSDGRSLPADQLYMDNTTEITRFVNDMLAAGKKRIGFIGNYNHCQSFYERYAAFRMAMLMADVPVDGRYVFCNNHVGEIIESIAGLEQLPDVFSIGKSVPDDVLVLGFDNSPESRIFRPALSTIHIHTQVMAFAAMQLLISRRHEPSLDSRIVHTETELIYRDSTRLN